MRKMSTPPDNAELPRGYDAWVAVARNYQKCFRLLSRVLEPLGLSVAQHEALLTIGRSEGLTQQELADRLLVVKSNVSGLLQRLESQRLVSREPNPADARSKRILLTPRGHRVLLRSAALQARVVDAMMGPLDDRELELNREFSRRVGEVLDARLRELDGEG
jgi:DNA-binding MarR family transcriptional regulator